MVAVDRRDTATFIGVDNRGNCRGPDEVYSSSDLEEVSSTAYAGSGITWRPAGCCSLSFELSKRSFSALDFSIWPLPRLASDS